MTNPLPIADQKIRLGKLTARRIAALGLGVGRGANKFPGRERTRTSGDDPRRDHELLVDLSERGADQPPFVNAL
jgi:hypothetical protein